MNLSTFKLVNNPTSAILAILFLYLVSYHIAKTVVEIALLFTFPAIISILFRKKLKVIELTPLLAFLFYASLFIYSSIKNSSPIDTKNAINVIRATLPIGLLLLYFIQRRKKIRAHDFIATMSVTCIVCGSLSLILWSETNFQGRISLNTNLILIYSTVIGTLCLACYTLLCHKKNLPLFLKLLLLTGFVMSLISLIATGSRGTWLSLIIGVILTSIPLIIKSKKFAMICFLSLFCTIGLLLQSKYVTEKINIAINNSYLYLNERNKNINTSEGLRLEMWRLTINDIIESPFKMRGSFKMKEHFSSQFTENQHSSVIGEFDHVHNDYLQAWHTLGFLGFLTILFIIISPIIINKNNKISFHLALSLSAIYGFSALTNDPFLKSYSLGFFILFSYTIYLVDFRANHNQKRFAHST